MQRDTCTTEPFQQGRVNSKQLKCVCDKGWSSDNCATPICGGVGASAGCGGHGKNVLLTFIPLGFISNCTNQLFDIKHELDVYNTGTCIAPNSCRCSKGFSGPDCSVIRVSEDAWCRPSLIRGNQLKVKTSRETTANSFLRRRTQNAGLRIPTPYVVS